MTTLRDIKNLVDDLYDMIQTPTRDMSKQYLLIDEKLNELMDWERGYVSNPDPDDEDLVRELMSSEIGADPTKWGERRIY